MEFDVSEDGSGTYEMALEVDLEAIAGFADGEDVDPTSLCEESLNDAGGNELAGENAEIRTENDGSICRQIVTGSWSAGAAELVEGSGEEVVLTQVGEGWRFEYDVSPLTDDMSEDEGEELDPEMLALMGVEIAFSLSVTLPGSITEHNGDASGSTVSWEFNLLDPPEEAVLFAQSGAGGSGSSIGMIVIVVGLLLVAGVVVLVMRRRSSEAPIEPDQPGE